MRGSMVEGKCASSAAASSNEVWMRARSSGVSSAPGLRENRRFQFNACLSGEHFDDNSFPSAPSTALFRRSVERRRSHVLLIVRMRSTVWLVAMALCTLPAPVRAAAFDVAAYGAKGDAATVNTAAIQKAIDTAAKAGNGVVVFAPGVYLSGALFLKSHMELRLDEGVEIRGVQNLAAYPVMPTRVAGIEMPWPSALINVYRQSHVKIAGKGTIDGDGKIWWDKYWKMRREDYEPKGLRWAADYDCQRPRLIQIYRSENVRVEGLTDRKSTRPSPDRKYWKVRRENDEPKGLRWAADYDCQRPRLIQIYRSENVRVEGL